jgi:N4-(beta-N-acetylglucosaminyl)-L-asparaginase
MDDAGNYGAVCALRGIVHAAGVARRVMERTPHCILVGEGARQFALSEGFAEEDLLTKESRAAWEEWKKTSNYKPVINWENHDTIGMLALDKAGNLSGCCTTSGLAFKMHGRVGDSPIVGAGLYVDNEVGAATATGLGEHVLKTVGSFLIVELMRQEYSPLRACQEAVRRIVKKSPNYKEFQVGFLALNKRGEIGGFALHKGFQYALCYDGQHRVIDADYQVK